MEDSNFIKDLTSFLQEKGLIWGPEPEIYGGLAGFHSYGPLGKLLKNKVENNIRRVFQSNNLWELEAPLIMPEIVWKASGHMNFADSFLQCSKCGSINKIDRGQENKRLKCVSCNTELTGKLKSHNLMMKTEVGGVTAYLRPETATVTYLPFRRYHTFFRKKIPLGVFQIGKAFRNEISPRQSVIRGREFTQAEGQIFIDPKEKNNWSQYEEVKKTKLNLMPKKSQKEEKITLEEAVKKEHIKTKAYAWCLWLAHKQFVSTGIPESSIRLRQHLDEERAFYAEDAWDIEIKTRSFGWIEVCGVHDRTDYDLKQHQQYSKQSMECSREDGSKFIPHILEIAFGTDRPVFVLLDTFYEKKLKEEGKTMFKVPYHMAPIEVSIFPLLKKDKLPEKALEIKEILEKEFVLEYDESGSIGRRYLRSAEQGTPYAITVDHESLKKDDVTLRDRDTEKQIRVKINDLKEVLKKLINKEIELKDLGKYI
ncbi:MAG: glycine--tRNA ligase [Candidatus Woesearchaeota archaeon]|nr:MAG: glycine--tRNA ligase [Candidatus Woesearchaeota archaeon]